MCEILREWTTGNGKDGLPRVQEEVLAKDSEWLGTDGHLTDWDISRDAPYFGIAIPDAPGKYFYVWLDAPVGYLAALKAYSEKKGLISMNSFPTLKPNKYISSAKTLFTSIRSSGPPCCISPASLSVRRTTLMHTAS